MSLAHSMRLFINDLIPKKTINNNNNIDINKIYEYDSNNEVPFEFVKAGVFGLKQELISSKGLTR